MQGPPIRRACSTKTRVVSNGGVLGRFADAEKGSLGEPSIRGCRLWKYAGHFRAHSFPIQRQLFVTSPESRQIMAVLLCF